MVLVFEEEVVVEIEEGDSHHSCDQDKKDQEAMKELPETYRYFYQHLNKYTSQFDQDGVI